MPTDVYVVMGRWNDEPAFIIGVFTKDKLPSRDELAEVTDARISIIAVELNVLGE